MIIPSFMGPWCVLSSLNASFTNIIKGDQVPSVTSSLAITHDWWFWVNNATLALTGSSNDSDVPPTTSPFPYARPATSVVEGSQDFYLYHQINETTFVEDWYDGLVGYFNTTYFSVSTE